MLKNYFLVAIRHLRRQPGYALLNILGLTLGIASSLLIVLYLNQELSFDKQHEKADRIYRISSDFTEPDNAFRWAVTQVPLGRTVKEEFQEVDQFTRMVPSGTVGLKYEDQNIFAENMYLSDSTVFDVFTINILQGQPTNALDEPNSIVLSETLAAKIFSDENPIGKILKTENYSYKVTAVFEDFPKTTHILVDAMASFSTNSGYYNSQGWGGFDIYTYIVLNPQADAKAFEQKLNAEIIPKYVSVIFDQFDIQIVYELLNVLDIHLYSDFQGEPNALGNIEYVYIFLAVGIFLVLIACINYMNLATARSMRRSLEVGIRKVMGAQRVSLIRQFIIEAILITLVSVVISILVLLVAVPILNSQLDIGLAVEDLYSTKVLLLLAIIIFFTGILSGSYPAFYLSAFSPIKAIKGGAGSNRTGVVWVRRVLVGLQFSISMFMLISTAIIYQQMQYVREADIGFDQENVVSFSMNRQQRQKWNALNSQLKENPSITKTATASTTPGQGFSKNVMLVETAEGVMQNIGVDHYAVDFDFFHLLDIEVVAGRNIASTFALDTANAVLVNEAMVKRMNWEDPIGKRFQFDNDSTKYHRVVGVVKDFHQRSLYNPIEALLFRPNLGNSQALVKVEGDIEQGIAEIEDAWNKLFPTVPFEYSMLDQNFLRAYNEDKLRGRLFLGFAMMMIIISGLGLLGLASFTAEQRTKEISVRKVLGADVKELVFLLVKDFFWLVLVGALPASIVGYSLMSDWLESFQYHIDISYFTFIAILVLISLFVVLTTGYQAYKAATVNPSDNLKYE